MNFFLVAFFALLQIIQATEVNNPVLDTSIGATEINNTVSDTSTEAADVNNTLSDTSIGAAEINNTVSETSNEATEIDHAMSDASITAPQAVADAILSFIYSKDGEIDRKAMENVERAGISLLFVKHLARLAHKELTYNGASVSRMIEDMKGLRDMELPREEKNGLKMEPGWYTSPRYLKGGNVGGYKPKVEHMAISIAVLTAVRSFSGDIEGGDIDGGELHNLLMNAVSIAIGR